MIPLSRLMVLAYRELKANRARTWLLVACVAVAVAAMNVVTQMGASAERSVAEDVLRTQGKAGTYSVTVLGAAIASAMDATAPGDISGATGRLISLPGARLSSFAREGGSAEQPTVSIYAVDPAVRRSMPNALREGRWLTAEDADSGVVPIVVTSDVIDRLRMTSSEGLELGTVLRVDHEMPAYVSVVGVLDDGPLARSSGGAGAFVPLGKGGFPTALRDWLRSLDPGPDEVRLYLSSSDETDAVATRALAVVREELMRAGEGGADTSMQRVDTAQDFDGSTRMLSLIFRGIGLVVLVIGVTAVGTVSASSLRERSSELALRRAMGASPWSLGCLVLTESLMVIILGAVFGLVLVVVSTTALAAWVVTGTQEREFLTIDLATAVTSLIATGTLGVLVGLLPARKAARMNVMDVLAA